VLLVFELYTRRRVEEVRNLGGRTFLRRITLAPSPPSRTPQYRPIRPSPSPIASPAPAAHRDHVQSHRSLAENATASAAIHETSGQRILQGKQGRQAGNDQSLWQFHPRLERHTDICVPPVWHQERRGMSALSDCLNLPNELRLLVWWERSSWKC
jgi:hypothetical protein